MSDGRDVTEPALTLSARTGKTLMDSLFYAAMGVSLLILAGGLTAPNECTLLGVIAVFSLVCLPVSLCCFGVFSMPVVTQLVGTWLGLPFLLWPRSGARCCRIMAVLAFLGGWGYATILENSKRIEHNQLCDEYPLESLEPRIAPPLPSVPNDPARYDGLYQQIGKEAEPQWYMNNRNTKLKELHEKQFKWFAQSPNFGAWRMPYIESLNRTHLNRDLNNQSIPQYTPPFVGIESSGDEITRDVYNPFHNDALLNFLAPQNWGYRQGNARVAGFRSHGFGSKLEPPKKHTLQRVELVGLLKNPTPVVYVTDNLPRMDELAGVPTRDPDTFEADAINRVKAGEDLIARQIGTTVRLLGSIRTLQSCLDCHTGNKGDLLGAFTYRLRIDE